MCRKTDWGREERRGKGRKEKRVKEITKRTSKEERKEIMKEHIIKEAASSQRKIQEANIQSYTTEEDVK